MLSLLPMTHTCHRNCMLPHFDPYPQWIAAWFRNPPASWCRDHGLRSRAEPDVSIGNWVGLKVELEETKVFLRMDLSDPSLSFSWLSVDCHLIVSWRQGNGSVKVRVRLVWKKCGTWCHGLMRWCNFWSMSWSLSTHCQLLGRKKHLSSYSSTLFFTAIPFKLTIHPVFLQYALFCRLTITATSCL